MGKEGEALVVCSDRSMGAGITIWDMETGDRILHVPTCASPVHGMLCLRQRFLVASQVNKHGSVGGGAVFTWPLNKPQQPLRSYPIEAIGPLASTMDGLYLAGGSPSGNAYLWEVTNGRLLKTWRAHRKSVKCMVFSKDDSLLISGSDDGVISVWSLISLLDSEDIGKQSSLVHCLSEHKSSITSFSTTLGSANPAVVSSSLDSTCKAWDLVSGQLIQTQVYPQGITATVLHPSEQVLFAGSIDGRIFVTVLNIGPAGDLLVVADCQTAALKGHNGSITALAFTGMCLLSASEDCSVCLWDVTNWMIIRRFNHKKGPVTNLLPVPKSSLLPASNHQRIPNLFHVSPLDKCPQRATSSNGLITLHSCSSHKDHQTSINFRSGTSLDQQVFEMEQEQTPTAMQMKIETNMDQRAWAIRMTNHVMEMNKHLKSRLLDLMQIRELGPRHTDTPTTVKNKKLKIKSLAVEVEKPSESSG